MSSKLYESVMVQLITDQKLAEATTSCLRRGTASRAAAVVDGVLDIQPSIVYVNGSVGCTGAMGSCGCCHAEQRLVVDLLRRPVSPKRVLLSTLEPCQSCANLVVESALFDVVAWLMAYRGGLGRQVLVNAGIACVSPETPFVRVK